MFNFHFFKYTPAEEKDKFEALLDLFLQLIQYTDGDVAEALNWMNQLDQQHGFTDNNYAMGDFINDLKERGYIREEERDGTLHTQAKTEQSIRQRSLEEIFGNLRKAGKGQHKTNFTGIGDELSSDLRKFEFGDNPDMINFPNSLRNAQINHGLDEFRITEEDLEVQEKELKTQNSTVLMIDISHSMILYGEDRITPAKKVAMALTELIKTRYPKDTLDIIVFGDDAWPIEIKDLPYLQVGPYHTNTCAGLELAMDILRRRKSPNKQVFMITDGKPTCLKEPKGYYKNSFGLDRKITNKTLNMAAQCKRLGISVTTFMIASDHFLQEFVRDFTRVNNGRAFYSSLNGLGEYIFEDYIRNRKKTMR